MADHDENEGPDGLNPIINGDMEPFIEGGPAWARRPPMPRIDVNHDKCRLCGQLAVATSKGVAPHDCPGDN